jgi:oligopeptide/dipeptide ABC transporter ATP-binding protein
MGGGSSVLEVRDLTVRYFSSGPPITALHGLSLEIQAGECVGVLGESGAGKSTLALSVMRLLPGMAKCDGGIRFRGVDIMQMSERSLRSIRGQEIALIQQEPERVLHPMLRAGDGVAEVLRAHRDWPARRCREAAAEALDRVFPPGSSHAYARYPHQLSGGQKQRVALAQAISCSPALLIADEPTSALDAVSQAAILHLLDRLRRQTGMAMLFISHDPGVLATVADRIVVMFAGRVVEAATLEELARAPKHPYTLELLACMPKPLNSTGGERAANALAAPEPPGPALPHGGCPYEPECRERMDRCREAQPPVVQVAGSHTVRCFMYVE